MECDSMPVNTEAMHCVWEVRQSLRRLNSSQWLTHRLSYGCGGGDGGSSVVVDRLMCRSTHRVLERSLDRWMRHLNRWTIFCVSFLLLNWVGNDLMASIHYYGLPVPIPHFPLSSVWHHLHRYFVMAKTNRVVVVAEGAAAAADG